MKLYVIVLGPMILLLALLVYSLYSPKNVTTSSMSVCVDGWKVREATVQGENAILYELDSDGHPVKCN